MIGEWSGGKGTATRQGFNKKKYDEGYDRIYWWRKLDMGDFFDMTVGRIVSDSTAHVRLKPEARILVKENCGCTDEELDAALEDMGRLMTKMAHSDMKKLRARTHRQQAERLIDLIAKAKERKSE